MSRKHIHTITLDCGHVRTSFSNKPGEGYYCIECAKLVSLGIKDVQAKI